MYICHFNVDVLVFHQIVSLDNYTCHWNISVIFSCKKRLCHDVSFVLFIRISILFKLVIIIAFYNNDCN